MSIVLEEDCLDKWLGDFDAFRVDFLRVCNPLCMALGFELDFDQKQLEIAHIAWRQSHELWHGHKVNSSSKLSHVKMIALLLYQLTKVSWVRSLLEYKGDYHRYSGSPEDRAEDAKDLNAAREIYLSLYFSTLVLNWFEALRNDKQDIFVYRMTSDLEFDFTHFLLSNEKSETAVFLILSALYARD